MACINTQLSDSCRQIDSKIHLTKDNNSKQDLFWKPRQVSGQDDQSKLTEHQSILSRLYTDWQQFPKLVVDVALRSFMAYCRSPHLHLCYMPESLYHQQSRKPRAHQVRQTWSFPRNGLACTTKQGGTAAEIDCCIMSVSNRTAEMERHQKKCEKKRSGWPLWGVRVTGRELTKRRGGGHSKAISRHSMISTVLAVWDS